MLNNIKIKIKFFLMKYQWRRKNRNNFTYPKNLCDIDRIEIGDYTYGGIDAESYGCPESFLRIGRFCSIAKNVRFILDGEHDYRYISTYPFKVRFYGEKNEALCKGPIQIDDDVWIGERSIILSGVHVGQGAIIGAGSVVTKDVPPYAIYAGNRVVKYRFSEVTIAKLLTIDYRKLEPNTIRENLEKFYIDVETMEDISWLPLCD